MTVDESLQTFGLVPLDESLPAIRALLEREAEAERNGRDREEDLALLCCVQLFSRGLLEDVLLIWAAKRSGVDLGVYVDVEFLCGAGLETTRQFLASHGSPEATSALRYVEWCELAGAFSTFSPEEHLQRYRDYFAERDELEDPEDDDSPTVYAPVDPTPRHPCPCCDYVTLAERSTCSICRVCFWESDGDIDSLDERSEPNQGITLREARDNFRLFGACEMPMVKHVVLPEQRASFEHRPRHLD
jgi:hypothetical protein